MTSQTSLPRWRVVLFAAARLAAVYAFAAAVLLLPLFLLSEGPPTALLDIVEFARPLAVLFAIAFVFLAIARRAGLLVLWLLLGLLWVGAVHQSALGQPHPSELYIAFVVWSTLAIPLALLGGLGVPATLRLGLGRWTPTALAVTAVVWAWLLVPAVALFVLPEFGIHPLDEAASYRIARGLGWFLWAPGAPLIVILSIAHVWVGTTPAKVPAPAA